MTFLAAFALAGCLAVPPGSDHITVRELAPVFAGLESIAPDTTVALAPAPGVRRVMGATELRQIAARLHVGPPAASELCFERPVAPLEPARLLEAMRQQLPGAAIEILDYSRLPVPQGQLEFPIRGLRQTSDAAFWNGAVTYAGNRRVTVWAKVKVSILAPRVIATADLKAARAVAAGELRLEMRQDFPDAGLMTSVEDVAGRVLRRPVAAGTAIRALWLDPAKDVERGDTVKVEVWSGGAHLEFDAEAEASGSRGETIPVCNPVSKKRFPALVEGKGRVSVGKGNP